MLGISYKIIQIIDKYSAPYFEKGPHRIGGVYRKAVYREYTDATFTVQKQRGPDDVHLALMGPTLRGEVGDIIKVTFRNKASWPYSIDTHGAYYLKNGESNSLKNFVFPLF
ncbi:UNVERIFIED_CONTAM: Ceruloplasmin [Trichonephila clavipes]